MRNASSLQLFPLRHSGQSGLRGVLLFVLCLMVSLRAFALPLSMSSHNDLPGQHQAPQISVWETSPQPAVDCHEDVGRQAQSTHDGAAAETAKLCQIMCDIASAPLLMFTQADLAATGFEVMNAAKASLFPGITPPPDHPPPIA